MFALGVSGDGERKHSVALFLGKPLSLPPQQTSNRYLSSSGRHRHKTGTCFIAVRSEILVSFLPVMLLMGNGSHS